MRNARHTISTLLFAAAVATAATDAHAATCTPTGFIRDGIDMTAALINPATVIGTVDATGCNIGIYYDSGLATLNRVVIHGANYFGILVNGDVNSVAVNFSRNIIHTIGEAPFNGAQHGVGIYIRAFFPGSTVAGIVNENVIFAYQKGGIVVNGPGARLAQLSGNEVHGLGHVDFIAQNGIQIGFGAMPYPNEVLNNRVTANSYIGEPGDGSASAGILVVGGAGYGSCPDGNPCAYTKTVLVGVNTALTAFGANRLFNNDVGVYVSNIQADGSAPLEPTVNFVAGNTMGTDRCFNNAYQAGISDVGHTDYIIGNHVLQGGGYGPACGFGIDVTGSTNPQVVGNNVPPTTTPPTATRQAAGAVKFSPVK